MDPELAEIKRTVAQNAEIAKDTNRRVRSLESRARWGTFFRLVYWVIIIAFFVGSYVFISPYITQLLDVYSGLQTTINSAQGAAEQTQSYLQDAVQAASRYLPQQPR